MEVTPRSPRGSSLFPSFSRKSQQVCRKSGFSNSGTRFGAPSHTCRARFAFRAQVSGFRSLKVQAAQIDSCRVHDDRKRKYSHRYGVSNPGLNRRPQKGRQPLRPARLTFTHRGQHDLLPPARERARSTGAAWHSSMARRTSSTISPQEGQVLKWASTSFLSPGSRSPSR